MLVLVPNRWEAGTEMFGGTMKYVKTLNWMNMEKEELDKAMAYLEEKIALVKKNGTWEGVDVDAYMDEVRGREPDDNS